MPLGKINPRTLAACCVTADSEGVAALGCRLRQAKDFLELLPCIPDRHGRNDSSHGPSGFPNHKQVIRWQLTICGSVAFGAYSGARAAECSRLTLIIKA